jgi:hypothetical protein
MRASADGDRVKIMTLAAEEFIRRLLLHASRAASSASGTSASWPTARAAPSSRGADYDALLGHGTTVNIGLTSRPGP